MKHRIIVAGGRDFSDYELLRAKLGRLLDPTSTTIISGGARGADALSERYAHEHGLPIERYPADWERFGRGAGYKRNEQMARAATGLVAFWNGESRGTKHMIDIARTAGLAVRVVRY
jgi:hypothetical protein